jgi:Acetyltransferase (GNAT) domain
MTGSSWSAATRELWVATFSDRYLPLGQTWEWGEAKRAIGQNVGRFLLDGSVGIQFERRRGVAWAPAAPIGDVGDAAAESLQRLSRQVGVPMLVSPVDLLPGLGAPTAVGMFHSGTVVFDCSGDDAALRGRLRKTWRNSLSKGERSDVQIGDGSIEELLNMLDELATRKGFELPYGPSFVRALQGSFGSGFAVRIARQDGHAVGGRLDLRAGVTATLFLNATALEGRALGASYLLTWDALRRHRDAGVLHYDLGGISDDRASGTSGHKVSMGGETIDYPGTYLIGTGLRALAVRSWLRLKHGSQRIRRGEHQRSAMDSG